LYGNVSIGTGRFRGSLENMRGVFLGVGFMLFLLSAPVFAQARSVAITVDDLPYAGVALGGPNASDAPATAELVNRKLLTAFHAYHVPVTGFVIQKNVEAFGAKIGPGILQAWINGGFDLGNHTYSHPDINVLPVEQIEQEIVHGESAIGPLIKGAGNKLRFFRFPMNHTGDTREKHDLIAAFLSRRGYTLATCTIENSDYIFNNVYTRLLARDVAGAQRLRAAYLVHTSQEIDYYAALNRQVLGYEPPQVMLLHDNRLNADVIGEVLKLFEEKKYRFVSLDAAQADAAYHTPETYITKFGPMWGYRWARERNVKVNGALEPEPPEWILQYGKDSENPPRPQKRRTP
jgi:peptidoglycan/xylan/chitin deacetylase (PgdA/CDA1 family)